MRKMIVTGMAVAMLAIPSVASAAPSLNPVEGPGCFGQWRAGSVQAVNETDGAVYGIDVKNAGEIFSTRAHNEGQHNVADKAVCAAL